MKSIKKGSYRTSLLAAAAVLALAALSTRDSSAAEGAASETASSRSGGLFPNDAGPAKIDVSKYPKDMQKTYSVFAEKCSVCHTIARPINSQFLELSDEEQKKAKTDEPDIFADPRILAVESSIWNRYVKRMMAKRGCPVGKDGKRIWEFLVYDSKTRKTGANLKAWIEGRKKLVEDFKKSEPAAYDKLFGTPDDKATKKETKQ